MKYYFAYGSNLWRAQMDARCPGSRLVGPGLLPGWRWLINSQGYATIVAAVGEVVHGMVYTLTAGDEQALDAYEEVAAGLYRKCDCDITVGGQELRCMVYVSPVTAEGRPGTAYIARINHGLRDANLPEEYVRTVIRRFVPAAGAQCPAGG